MSLNHLIEGTLLRLSSPISRSRVLVVPAVVRWQSHATAPAGAAPSTNRWFVGFVAWKSWKRVCSSNVGNRFITSNQAAPEWFGSRRSSNVVMCLPYAEGDWSCPRGMVSRFYTSNVSLCSSSLGTAQLSPRTMQRAGRRAAWCTGCLSDGLGLVEE